MGGETNLESTGKSREWEIQSKILLTEKNIKQLSLGSSVCTELSSVTEGIEFHFKFDAAFRSLSINFNELWIKHSGRRKAMLKLNLFFFFLKKGV